MHGNELKEWRKRNKYTQDALRIALGLGSRQTIITWEASEDRLPLMTQLALAALEHGLGPATVTGHRYTAAELPGVRENMARLPPDPEQA